MFRKISNDSVKLDHAVSNDCMDFLKQLLNKDPTKRFNGNASLIKQHAWFKDIDWKKVESRLYSTPFPNEKDNNDVPKYD